MSLRTHPSSFAIKNASDYSSISQYVLEPWYLINRRNCSTFWGTDCVWRHELEECLKELASVYVGSTQSLVKMSTRNIPGVKGGRCVRLTTSQPTRAECHEIWKPKPPGTLWATTGLLRESFTFTFSLYQFVGMNEEKNMGNTPACLSLMKLFVDGILYFDQKWCL